MPETIIELHQKLLNGEVTSKDLIDKSLKLSHEVQKKYNAFVTILDDAKPNPVTDELLSGIPYGIKDNYSTKDNYPCKNFKVSTKIVFNFIYSFFHKKL